MKGVYYKLRSICIGWYRYLFAKRSEKAQLRIDICGVCQFKKGRFCGVCFCELHAKAESDDDCPKGYWPKIKEATSKTDDLLQDS